MGDVLPDFPMILCLNGISVGLGLHSFFSLSVLLPGRGRMFIFKQPALGASLSRTTSYFSFPSPNLGSVWLSLYWAYFSVLC